MIKYDPNIGSALLRKNVLLNRIERLEKINDEYAAKNGEFNPSIQDKIEEIYKQIEDLDSIID